MSEKKPSEYGREVTQAIQSMGSPGMDVEIEVRVSGFADYVSTDFKSEKISGGLDSLDRSSEEGKEEKGRFRYCEDKIRKYLGHRNRLSVEEYDAGDLFDFQLIGDDGVGDEVLALIKTKPSGSSIFDEIKQGDDLDA